MRYANHHHWVLEQEFYERGSQGSLSWLIATEIEYIEIFGSQVYRLRISSIRSRRQMMISKFFLATFDSGKALGLNYIEPLQHQEDSTSWTCKYKNGPQALYTEITIGSKLCHRKTCTKALKRPGLGREGQSGKSLICPMPLAQKGPC